MTAVLMGVVAALALLVVAQLIGYRTMVVRSGSMGDTVPVGSLVLTEVVPSRGIQVGDIAVVDPEGLAAPRLHRVIDVEGDGDSISVVTRGDANPTPDNGRTELPDTVPVPAMIIPWVGYAMSGAGSRAGLLGLATGASIILGWWFVRSMWSRADHGHDADGIGSALA